MQTKRIYEFMTKEELIKYIQGELSPREEAEVTEWINESPENMQRFAAEKNLWVLSTMPDEEADEAGFRKLAEKIDKRRRVRAYYPLLRFAAIFIIAAAIGINLYMIIRQHNATAIADATGTASDYPAQTEVTLYTPKGVKGYIVLPDSSKVWLNSDTKISYPAWFSDTIRSVMLNGEAYFEVRKDSLHPMVVNTTKGIRVEVLGTKFLLRAYPGDEQSKATLFSGSINLYVDNGKKEDVKKTKMKPLETVLIDSENTVTLLANTDTSRTAKWKQGELIFDEASLKTVFKELERWHNLQFEITDPQIYNYHLTAKFRDETADQILNIIEYCTPVTYTYKEDKILISHKSNN